MAHKGWDVRTLATQRSLAYLRKRGWQVAIVEKYIKHPNMKFGRRIDVFGFGDLLACRPRNVSDVCLQCKDCQGKGCEECKDIGRIVVDKKQIALIQCFPTAQWKAHVEKIKDVEILAAIRFWKAAGGIVLLHGWAKRNKGGIRGARKEWQLREEII